MAEIKPFRALRYAEAAGDISTLTCPPYDVISEEQRRAFLLENPHNVIRLELPKGDRPYEEAGETLREWKKKGVLTRDTDPGFYLYEEEFTVFGKKKRVLGLICLVRLEEYEKGIVLPHEETLSKAKEDRFKLIKKTFCNFSQIYSLYIDEDHKTLKRLGALASGKPRYEFSDGEVVHRLWLVNDLMAIREIQGDFADRKLFIADGHHRYETALNFRNWCRSEEISKEGGDPDYVMMTLVDMESDGLVVFPTHRLVFGLKNFSEETLTRGCEEFFDVIPREGLDEMEPNLDALYLQGKKAFACYCGGEKWNLLILRDEAAAQRFLPEKSAAYRGLDVTVLHRLILERVLGIDEENMVQQVNLTYTRSAKDAVASVRDGTSQCAFLLNPTRIRQIRDVAEAGEKMPQKSTYFYPKLITGLVMNEMDT